MAKTTFTRDKPHLTPVPPPTGDLTSITVVTTAGVITKFDVDFTVPDIAGYYWKIEAASPVGAGKMSISRSKLKRVCTVLNVGLAGTIDLVATYIARFGTVEVGSKIFVRGVLVDSVSGYDWDMGIFNTKVTGT